MEAGIPTKQMSGFHDNMIRCQFNDMVRKECLGKEPISDLALVGSTFSDGIRASFEKDGHP
jgi:hypothetical protein